MYIIARLKVAFATTDNQPQLTCSHIFPNIKALSSPSTKNQMKAKGIVILPKERFTMNDAWSQNREIGRR